ncbi:MAG TPA: hypothetical protein VM942_06750, partial [Acidimicrobiales bacterium]|nr:hypothetical protein [Acidimicrobiales bacterium]
GPADARRDVVRLATVLRQLLAAGPSTASRKAAHRQLDKAVDRAVSGDGKRPPADAPAFLAALEQAARTDFGKRWAERTPLAPLAAAPSPGSAPEVEPAAAAIIEADEIPVDDARPMAVDEPAPPAEPAPAAAVRADDRPEPAVSTKWGDNVPVPDPGSADAGPGGDRGRSGDDRRPRRRRLVRAMSGVILILLGAGVAVAVERIQSTDARSDDARVSGAARTLSGPTPAEIEASDITGTWDMKLVVVESTGFFGTQVGNSVEKIYTVTSDCSARPCSYTLVVTGQPGEFELRQDPDGYVLSESGPNDCIDLPAGTVRVRNGGVASVQAHLRPSGAARTPRGDWAATGLTGSIVTTFDTSHPGCVQGPGVQRSTVTGTRR